MRAYANGFWLYKTEGQHAAQILKRDALNDGCSRFILDTIQACCDNHLRERELANLVGKNNKTITKTRAQIETEEALREEFIF